MHLKKTSFNIAASANQKVWIILSFAYCNPNGLAQSDPIKWYLPALVLKDESQDSFKRLAPRSFKLRKYTL